jgi:hypothetical protein
MIHVEVELAIGTVCLGSNTWPLDTTWLQRSVTLLLSHAHKKYILLPGSHIETSDCEESPSMFIVCVLLCVFQMNPDYEEERLEFRSSVSHLLQFW